MLQYICFMTKGFKYKPNDVDLEVVYGYGRVSGQGPHR